MLVKIFPPPAGGCFFVFFLFFSIFFNVFVRGISCQLGGFTTPPHIHTLQPKSWWGKKREQECNNRRRGGSGGDLLAAVLGFNARRPFWLPVSRLSLLCVVSARPCRHHFALFPFRHCVHMKGSFSRYHLLLLFLLYSPINQLTPVCLFPNTLGSKGFFFLSTSATIHF